MMPPVCEPAAGPRGTPARAMPRMYSVGIAVCLMFFALGSRFAAADEPILRGIASVTQPISGGTIVVFDGPDPIQTEPYRLRAAAHNAVGDQAIEFGGELVIEPCNHLCHANSIA